jgi:hypothetical protein
LQARILVFLIKAVSLTAVSEVVTVAQTTRQTDHKLICLELAVGCNQGCMNEVIKLQEGVTTSVLHASEELSPVVAVHEGVTTAVPEVVTVAQTTRQTDHKLNCLGLAAGCDQDCLNDKISSRV